MQQKKLTLVQFVQYQVYKTNDVLSATLRNKQSRRKNLRMHRVVHTQTKDETQIINKKKKKNTHTGRASDAATVSTSQKYEIHRVPSRGQRQAA